MEFTFNVTGKCNLQLWIREILLGVFLVTLPNQQCVLFTKKALASDSKRSIIHCVFLSIQVVLKVSKCECYSLKNPNAGVLAQTSQHF